MSSEQNYQAAGGVPKNQTALTMRKERKETMKTMDGDTDAQDTIRSNVSCRNDNGRKANCVCVAGTKSPCTNLERPREYLR